MDFEMIVKKHRTEEGDDHEPVYSVILKADIKLGHVSIQTVRFSSKDETIQEEYPIDDHVTLRVTKPQQKLVKEVSTRQRP